MVFTNARDGAVGSARDRAGDGAHEFGHGRAARRAGARVVESFPRLLVKLEISGQRLCRILLLVRRGRARSEPWEHGTRRRSSAPRKAETHHAEGGYEDSDAELVRASSDE